MELHLQKMSVTLAGQPGLPHEAALGVIHHNCSRGLIELICVTAKKLGFDAIYGHEVDRHSDVNKVTAQPWLAILSKCYISAPEWVV